MNQFDNLGCKNIAVLFSDRRNLNLTLELYPTGLLSLQTLGERYLAQRSIFENSVLLK